MKAGYTYLSDGTKARALDSSGVGYDYLGSFTYAHDANNNTTLESVAFGGGRVRKNVSGYAVDYYITDHLGSVRAIVNASGTITEQNDYYPFGTRHPNGLTTLSGNRWRFSGKEEQDAAFGVPYSDFGARLYDRTAWTAIDPLAEKYYAVSPYAYCNNNPVRFVDPNGLIWDDPEDALLLEIETSMRIFDYTIQKNIHQNIIESHLFSDEVVAESSALIQEYDKRIAFLSKSISDIHLLSSDPDRHYRLDPVLSNDHYVKSRSNVIYIETSSDALSLHEISHVRQALEKDILLFKNGKMLNVGGFINEQINNEVEAYKIQFSFDPNSFPGTLYGSNGIDGVNRYSVSNIMIDGQYAYPFNNHK